MNLAFKDIRHHRFKYFSSTLGVALLLVVVLAIGGIIRGVILDSATIIEETAADLWVVEKGTLGPFVEISRIPEDYHDAIEAIQGVAKASPLVMAWEHVVRPPRPTRLMRFMYRNALVSTKTMVKPGWMQMPMEGRFVVIGYEPGGIGGPPALVAGRGIEVRNYEIVADVKTGFQLGERVRLGNHDYTVVGHTANMVGFTADPVIYATLGDAQEILLEDDPDLLRNQRERLRQQFAQVAALAPRLADPLTQQTAAVVENTHFANAIAVELEPGVSPETVAGEIARWKRLQVYTAPEQVNLQLMGSNRLILFQLSVFRALLVVIAGIIIALIIYTFTLDKVKEIAVLKLLGSPGRRIYRMILLQAVLMGVLGTVLGGAIELAIQDYFPRRVLTTYGDIAQMLVVMIFVTGLASLLAVRRATKVDARSVLGN